jgi:hypothetical protein
MSFQSGNYLPPSFQHRAFQFFSIFPHEKRPVDWPATTTLEQSILEGGGELARAIIQFSSEN